MELKLNKAGLIVAKLMADTHEAYHAADPTEQQAIEADALALRNKLATSIGEVPRFVSILALSQLLIDISEERDEYKALVH